jgi:hypothetical protein
VEHRAQNLLGSRTGGIGPEESQDLVASERFSVRSQEVKQGPVLTPQRLYRALVKKDARRTENKDLHMTILV